MYNNYQRQRRAFMKQIFWQLYMKFCYSIGTYTLHKQLQSNKGECSVQKL